MRINKFLMIFLVFRVTFLCEFAERLAAFQRESTNKKIKLRWKFVHEKLMEQKSCVHLSILCEKVILWMIFMVVPSSSYPSASHTRNIFTFIAREENKFISKNDLMWVSAVGRR